MIRCDNGPEYMSGALLAWAEQHGIRIAHPAEQAATDCQRRTLQAHRALYLACLHLFDPIEQVHDKGTRWLRTYNHEHPKMALGGITRIQKLALAG